MSDTDSPAALAARAQAAALARREDTRHPPTWSDPTWAERAHAVVSALADLLAIPRHRIALSVDYLRDYGDWPWPQMTVTDPDGTIHTFTAAYNLPARLCALGPCPTCRHQVPLITIRTLADYGDLLDGTALAENTFDPVAEFRGDPGHADACPHRIHH
jgi:hypothetical protein